MDFMITTTTRTFVLLICCVYLSFASDLPACTIEFGVDISDGETFPDGSIVKDNVTYVKDNYVVENNDTQIGCICKIKPCLRKCCPLGQYLTNKTCQFTETPFIIPKTMGPSPDEFHIINGFDCRPNLRRSLLNPRVNKKLGEFVVQKDGVLFLPNTKERFEQINYCVDYIEELDEIKALACVVTAKLISSTNVIGMMISMPFLLATFLVYALLPERNLHRKALMCYVITLFSAYFLLVIIQLDPDDLEDNACITVGILCLFFFMISFFFMNVISIDIWWTFSGLRGFSGSKAQTERNRFLLYCGYAFGVPFLFLLIVTYLTVDTSFPQDAWYVPGIASGQCWFQGQIQRLIYFNGPIVILITANIILFVLTALRIRRIQKDTAAVLNKDESKKHNYERDKRRFNLYLKLMLAMGVNWLFEIISWLVDWQVGQVPPAIWFFTDFLNAVYGVFIFFIFAFKKSIWKALKERFSRVRKQSVAPQVTLVDYSPNQTDLFPRKKSSTTTTTAISNNNSAALDNSEVAQ